MAVNPITSNSLTVDFKSLMKIPVGDRVQAASYSQEFLQSILNALTPIQIAKAFPDYYRRSLPDVSNFVTSNITARNGGIFNQTGGGEAGYTPAGAYDGETKIGGQRPMGVPEPTIEEMKKKLLEKGIDVDGTINLVKQGAILEGDERMAALKGMTDDELKAAGMQRSQDESGKTIIQMAPSQYEGMTNEKILEEYKKEFPAISFSDKERATLDFIAKREGAKDPNIIFGGNRYKERLGLDKTPLTERSVAEVINEIMPKLRELSKADGFGVTDDGRVVGTSAVGTGQMIEGTLKDNLRSLGIPEEDWGKIKFTKELQEKLTLENFKTSGIGDPNADPRTWNMGRLGQQYESLNVGRGHAPMTEQEKNEIASKSSERPVAPGENVLPEEALRKLQEAEAIGYNEALTQKLFNQASPTSSEAIPDPEGRTVVEQQGKVAAVRRKPITPELKEVLQYAGEESGVVVEVFSGGQNDITQGGNRTGSERHDLGHAADVKLKVVGPDGKMRVLDARVPEDRAIMGKFVETARMMGAKGIGSGLGYMGESGIHIGTVMRSDIDYSNKEYGAPAGKEAVWESDKWAQEAFSRGQQSAVEFEKAGGMAEYRKRREEKIAEQQKKESDKTAAAKQQETVQITEKSGAELLPESHPFAMTAEKKKRIIEAQNVAAAATPAPQFALGGNMYGLNEDMTLVNTNTGEAIAQIGQNEKLEKQGTSMQVTSETKLKADELSQQYDKSELETRMDDIENSVLEKQNEVQMRQRENAPRLPQNNPPEMWQQHIAAGYREDSPSFNRAMARTKFRPEGNHFNRATPGSLA